MCRVIPVVSFEIAMCQLVSAAQKSAAQKSAAGASAMKRWRYRC